MSFLFVTGAHYLHHHGMCMEAAFVFETSLQIYQISRHHFLVTHCLTLYNFCLLRMWDNVVGYTGPYGRKVIQRNECFGESELLHDKTLIEVDL